MSIDAKYYFASINIFVPKRNHIKYNSIARVTNPKKTL